MQYMQHMQNFKCINSPQCLNEHYTYESSRALFWIFKTAVFPDVQTSVAVISPSKAKSVCSLSVWFVKQTETVPSGKQENEKTQLVNL